MRKMKFATLPLIAGLILIFAGNANSQQHIIANKDNTRPETTRQLYSPARIISFTATRNNGYNDIRWTAMSEESARRFIVEYSFDGRDFQTAGPVSGINGMYSFNHNNFDSRPMLYRIRIEDLGQRTYYSDNIYLDGIAIAPVKIYPTIVTGDVVNINAAFPIERVTIVSGDAKQVFAKELNGSTDFIPLVIPSLNRGMYWITFYGNGWQNTQQFVIG